MKVSPESWTLSCTESPGFSVGSVVPAGTTMLMVDLPTWRTTSPAVVAVGWVTDTTLPSSSSFCAWPTSATSSSSSSLSSVFTVTLTTVPGCGPEPSSFSEND